MLSRILLIGLLLQFFVFNIVTHARGLDGPYMNIIWLRKEILLVVIGVISLCVLIKNKARRYLRQDMYTNIYICILLVLVGVTARLTLSHHSSSISTYVLAFKYDILGFFIVLLGYFASASEHSKHTVGDTQHTKDTNLTLRYGRIMKTLLFLALVRYLIILIKPGTLQLFGYNNMIFEGNVGAEAPAAYYTQINQGITRNQFLFERPTTRGFFLTAFFPLFYILFLHRRPARHTRAWRVIYGLNIILTFSRAARGAWIFEIILLGFLLRKNKKSILPFLLKIVLPVCVILTLLGFLAYDQIVVRSFSTVGHVNMLSQGRDMFISSPLRGVGAATAGPASHRGDMIGFNPENQFLQIMIEFGIIGFIPRMMLFGGLMTVGLKGYISNTKEKSGETADHKDILLACSIGLIGLAISGMVLHSRADRMVVYPYMFLFGVAYWDYSLQSRKSQSLS